MSDAYSRLMWCVEAYQSSSFTNGFRTTRRCIATWNSACVVVWEEEGVNPRGIREQDFTKSDPLLCVIGQTTPSSILSPQRNEIRRPFHTHRCSVHLSSFGSCDCYLQARCNPTGVELSSSGTDCCTMENGGKIAAPYGGSCLTCVKAKCKCMLRAGDDRCERYAENTPHSGVILNTYSFHRCRRLNKVCEQSPNRRRKVTSRKKQRSCRVTLPRCCSYG